MPSYDPEVPWTRTTNSRLNKFQSAQQSFLSPENFQAQASSVSDPAAWKELKRSWQMNPFRMQNPTEWRRLQDQFLYGNPVSRQADTETSSGRHGLLSRIRQSAYSETPIATRSGRIAMAKIAAFVGAASAIGAASAGGAAGGAGGAGGFAEGTGAGGYLGGTSGMGSVGGYTGGGGLLSKLGSGGGGGGMAGEGGGHWWDTFLGQAGINAGTNLIGGYLNQRAQNKSDQANQDAIKERIKLALSQLSPEHIQALIKQFLPQMAAMSNQQNQTALQGLNVSAARQGLAGTPYALTAEAGLRNQQANSVSQAAFERAMQVAGQSVGAIAGTPIFQSQPNTGYADAFSNTANQILLARALSQRQGQQAAPFQMSGIPGQGAPSPWQTQQYEGTPYQWGFNQGRY